MIRRFLLPLLCLGTFAQSPLPPNFRSTSINPDHSITFRYYDPTATKAAVQVDALGSEPFPMTKSEDGIWSATTRQLAPEIYGYTFQVDGRRELDPHNPQMTRNLLALVNMVEVPGPSPMPWDAQNIPHGEIHSHVYATRIVTGLHEDQNSYIVYTPPEYDAKAKNAYPVLYLLHGFSDDSYGWTAVGKANFILDALISEGKAKPMVAVMPLGYGDLSFLRGGFASWATPQAVAHNVDLFEQAVLNEIMPRVESEYHVSKKREDRAIVGLSMGGLESLTIGLRHTDKFAYVGGLSSSAANIDRASLANLTPKSADLRMLWIACGTEDRLIAPNRDFISFLKSKQLPVTAVETPGSHNWTVWRDNLIHFAPLLFQTAR